MLQEFSIQVKKHSAELPNYPYNAMLAMRVAYPWFRSVLLLFRLNDHDCSNTAASQHVGTDREEGTHIYKSQESEAFWNPPCS